MKLLYILVNFFKCIRRKKIIPESDGLEDNVPVEFLENEKILRTILAPAFIRKDNGLKTAAFRPDSNGETSVNRLSYTTADFCKRHGKNIENPNNEKSYIGFALLYRPKIYELECFLECKKELGNPYHANITFGAKPEKGQQLPPQISQKVQKLCEAAKFFRDNHISNERWMDGEIA